MDTVCMVLITQAIALCSFKTSGQLSFTVLYKGRSGGVDEGAQGTLNIVGHVLMSLGCA
jgi:hypothetical protein